MSITEWMFVGAFLLLGEHYFFLMQRSALEVCRVSEIPTDVHLVLLPGTYKGARLFSYGKFLPLAMLAWEGAWAYALGLCGGSFLGPPSCPFPTAITSRCFTLRSTVRHFLGN